MSSEGNTEDTNPPELPADQASAISKVVREAFQSEMNKMKRSRRDQDDEDESDLRRREEDLQRREAQLRRDEQRLNRDDHDTDGFQHAASASRAAAGFYGHSLASDPFTPPTAVSPAKRPTSHKAQPPSPFHVAPKREIRPFWDEEDEQATQLRWDSYKELEAAVQAGATPKDKSIRAQAKALFSQMRLLEKAMRTACVEGSGNLLDLAEIHYSMAHRAQVLKTAHRFDWATASVFDDKVTGGEDSFLLECHEIAEKSKDSKKKEKPKFKPRAGSWYGPQGNPFSGYTAPPNPSGWASTASGSFPTPGNFGNPGGYGNFGGPPRSFPPPSATATSGSGYYKSPEKDRSYDKYERYGRKRGSCDLCHEYGHWARDCPSKQGK